MSVLSILVLAVCILANLGSFALLARRSGSPRPFRRALLAVLSGVFVLVLGLGGTVLGLTQAFGAVASVSPEHKSELLAKGISDAMNATAFGIVGSLAPFVISVVLLFRRAPTTAR